MIKSTIGKSLLAACFLFIICASHGQNQTSLQTTESSKNAGSTDLQLPPDLLSSWDVMHKSKEVALKELNEAKFGMFIHWGLYAELAGEWKGSEIPGLGEWIMYHAMISKDEYGKLANDFNPVQFNAEEWVLAAKDAGMKYIVITSKHHDGFSMYDTKFSEFDIIDATPFNRDPIDELYHACKKHGVRFGVYYSHIIDWWDGWDGEMLNANRKVSEMSKDNPMNTWDPNKTTREIYIQNKSLPQVKELITKYPDLLEMWFDYWYEGDRDKYNNQQISYQFYKTLYDVSPNCLVSSRIGGGLGDFAAAGDNKILSNAKMAYWETPGTVNNTWGYSKFDNDWKTSEELLFWIVDIASKGGNYLLNVGPKPDGTIPVKSLELLKQVGSWMKVNGEAIYGTKKWLIDREGPNEIKMEGTDSREKEGFNASFTSEDLWFTSKNNNVYVTAFKTAYHGKMRINILAKGNPGTKQLVIRNVTVLGSHRSLKWKQNNEALEIQLPKSVNPDKGCVVKIELK